MFKMESFSNWVGDQSQDWVLAVRPKTVTQVQAVVRAARTLGLRVRVAGSTHSWSPIFSDKGQVVVYVKQLERQDGPRIQLEKAVLYYYDKLIIFSYYSLLIIHYIYICVL